ncbi:MAG: hypothetical protein AABW81_00040 [Nanoarchaeota archaeon]|mgnify:CR=1 FL=1
MVLTNLKVLELNEKYNLIEGLSERELKNPEGYLLELRVGEIFVLKKKQRGFLGVEKRKTPQVTSIASFEKHGNKIVRMKPWDYYLVSTIEKINCPSEKIEIEPGMPPQYIVPVIGTRTTNFRSGVALHCTDTNPGYSGKLTFGLSNLGPCDYHIQLGARMFTIKFVPLIGEIARAYEGQWQDGRTSTGGKLEEQV